MSCFFGFGGFVLANDLKMSDLSRLRVGALVLASGFDGGMAAASTCGVDPRDALAPESMLFLRFAGGGSAGLAIVVLLGLGAVFAVAVVATGAAGGGGWRFVLRCDGRQGCTLHI